MIVTDLSQGCLLGLLNQEMSPGFVYPTLCVCYVQLNALSLLLGMASNNQLPVFWSSWLQLPVQYDFSVSFSVSLH